MPSSTQGQGPGLATFLKSLKQNNIETSIELFISLLKRRQIRNSRPCALATTHLLLRVVAVERIRDAQKLIERIRAVGRRLVAAQPREMAVGNIVRRVLGVVREVVERDDNDSESGYATPAAPGTQTPMESSFSSPESILEASGRRPPLASLTSYAGQGPQSSSLLSFLENPLGRSPAGTPPATTGTQSPNFSRSSGPKPDKIDIKAEVIDGIKELLDELEVVDTQIAESALDHIHSNEIVLTHTSSQTVQKFLMTAARKRKFTVIHAEAYPNDHEATHATVVHGGKKASGEDDDADFVDERWKPLTSLGVTVVVIPDSAVFALMSRINKVILAPHAVLANGSLLAGAGASTIAHAARAHRVPVVVLSGVYKLSPVFPFDTEDLIEYGDPGKVVPFEDAAFMEKVEVSNPVYDWVEAELVDLYITNLGGCAPSFLYRIVADHYAAEDVDLSGAGTGMGMGKKSGK